MADSWLGQLWDWGSDAIGGSSTVVPEADQNTQQGDGYFSSTPFYTALLQSGLGLAGTYFKQTGDKALAEQAAAQRMKELEFAAKNKGGGGGGGGGGAGTALQIAKMNNLSALYQNYANTITKGGETQSDAAIKTGQLMTAPLNVRAGRL